MPEPILTMRQVAERLGITSRTIRIYAEEGFIDMERSGRTYLLRPVDVEVITVVERLKSDLGVNLAGIGVILEMRQKMMDLQAMMEDIERTMEQRMQQALVQDRRMAHRSVCSRMKK